MLFRSSLESPDNTILITEDSDSFNISVNPASGVFAGISNLYNNAIASDGFLVHSGVNFVNRIFATSSDLTLTNANGTGGNPTFGLAVPSQSDIDDGVSTKALSPATLSLMTIGGTLFNTLSGNLCSKLRLTPAMLIDSGLNLCANGHLDIGRTLFSTKN